MQVLAGDYQNDVDYDELYDDLYGIAVWDFDGRFVFAYPIDIVDADMRYHHRRVNNLG